MSKKEEQSEAYIKPIILDRNKKYLKEDNWELGLEYADFTGYEVQCAFESGWDACVEDLYKNKGFPVDLNGNVVSYEEALKHVELFNKHMKEEFLDRAVEFMELYILNHDNIDIFEMEEEFRKAMEEEENERI